MPRNRWALPIALALLLGATAVACSKSQQEKKNPYVAASEVCDGVFQGASARAVESTMGSSSFSSMNAGIRDRVADALKEGFSSGRSWTYSEEFCELNPKGTGGIGHAARIRFSIYAPRDIGDGRLAAGQRFYAMGKEAKSGPIGAQLYFECVSPQLKGSSASAARILGSLKLERDLRRDSVHHRQANLTIIHAVSLEMAKKLECANDGGLPSSPSFKEIPPAEEPPH